MRRRRTREDRGANALEWVGITLVSAVVIGALALAIPGPISDGLSSAICRIVHLGNSGSCEAPSDSALKPGCTTAVASASYGGSGEYGILDFGEDHTFIKTTTIDPETGRPRVTVTAIKGVSGGVGTGIGVGLHMKVANIGADASVGATVKVGNGDGWTYDGPDAEAKADALMRDIRRRHLIDAIKEHGGVVGKVGGTFYEAIATPKAEPPSIQRTERELNLGASASAGATVGLPPRNPDYVGRHRKQSWRDKLAKYDKRSSERISPDVTGSVGIDGNDKAMDETDTASGETTTTITLRGEVSYRGRALFVGQTQGRGQRTGAMKVTRDSKGRLTRVTFIQTQIVGGRATITTTALPITNDEQRAAVAEDLFLPLTMDGGRARALALTWDDMTQSAPPAPDATELQRLLYQNGTTSRVNYSYDEADEVYGSAVKFGLKLGVGINLSNSDQKVVSAEYLGAPSPDGTGHYRKYPECRS